MIYSDGNEAMVGDLISIAGQYRGTVVAVIERGEFSDSYPAEQWAYLREGMLVDTDFAGLVHYPSAEDEEFALLSRRSSL